MVAVFFFFPLCVLREKKRERKRSEKGEGEGEGDGEEGKERVFRVRVLNRTGRVGRSVQASEQLVLVGHSFAGPITMLLGWS